MIFRKKKSEPEGDRTRNPLDDKIKARVGDKCLLRQIRKFCQTLISQKFWVMNLKSEDLTLNFDQGGPLFVHNIRESRFEKILLSDRKWAPLDVNQR